MDKIDIVIPWVDGSDPVWRAERAKYMDAGNIEGAREINYRDWGILPHLFRSIEKYAPWVNKVFFITCGQKPEWLNENDPRLVLVDHKDFIPKEYLPTFNSIPIGNNVHRIKELSDRFVYFNDDTFLTAPTVPEDFFKNGLPCDSAEFSCLIPSVKNEIITYMLFNDMLLINSNFNKRAALKGNLGKWLNLKYGKGFLRNLYYLPIGKFTGFVDPHLPLSIMKSTYEECWEAEGETLDRVCRNRFRTKEDVNDYFFRYWRLVKGEFCPRSNKVGAIFSIGSDFTAIENALKTQKYKMICVNDGTDVTDFDALKQKVVALFDEVFPEKSGFEV